MESTRPIRALMRGLDALTVLNLRDGATVSDVVQDIRLPRTTVYRILETLCDSGFAYRDAADDRYRLTVRVRALSGGFDDETWIGRHAGPHIDALCRELVWPVSLATLSGTTMMVRATTDHHTPLAIERYSAGFRCSVLGTSAGRVHLAFSTAPERDALLEALARSGKDEDRLARSQPAQLQHQLSDIKAQGYAVTTHTKRPLDEVSVSVPVTVGDRLLAALNLRYLASAVPLKSGLERFLPGLCQCSARIGASYSQHRESTEVAATP